MPVDTRKKVTFGPYVLASRLTALQPLKWMHTLWTGPHRVSEQESYKRKILDLITNKTNAYCVPKFRKFYLHPTESNSADRARKNHLEFFILKTLSFKGDIERA
jgi:hypothetical protein